MGRILERAKETMLAKETVETKVEPIREATREARTTGTKRRREDKKKLKTFVEPEFSETC
jgi:hypothetical protein